ncbi:chemotaxis protein CheW [Pelovirga terrestris]|nr:chemotaxis protein CheW [Pelovirga terrestris]
MKKTILIYEPHCEQMPRLVFLLHLADISCIHARTVDEAINWLSAHRLQLSTFDLFLICSFSRSTPEQQLLLVLGDVSLPVVFLQRGNSPLTDLFDQNGIICHPEDLLTCINDCLSSTTHSTQGETIMTAPEEVNRDLSSINEDSMEGMYLTFDLASEGYGLEIRHVIEIIGIQPITAVPDLPDHVIGVLNLRGKVIPIIDVRRRFGLPHRDHDDRTCIVVVNVNENSVGLVVDKVSEVITIPANEIEPPPGTNRNGKRYIAGMGKIGQQVKILLDIEALLEDEELDEVAAA